MFRSAVIGFTLVFLSLATSCYSFRGISIPEGVETVQVNLFENQASLVVPSLSSDITEELKDEFQKFTDLDIVNRSADVVFNGVITGYSVRALAPTAGETTALNRLTITVKVEYFNTNNEEENWEQKFSRYEDFESTKSLTEVQDGLIELINERLIDDIFNKAFGNW